MTDYSQLVKRLRITGSTRTDGDAMREAADAIEALEAQVAELKAECAYCADTGHAYGDTDLARQGLFCGCKIGLAVERDRALLERKDAS